MTIGNLGVRGPQDVTCADPAFPPSWFGMSGWKSAHFSSVRAKVMQARRDYVIAWVTACAATMIASSIPMAQAWAQDVGFGLGDAYRYYADPGNGGGSAYAPFFDPYRGNRIVRGAYPDADYDGYGFHYGKSVPPSLDVDPRSYDPQSYLSNDSQDHGDRYQLRESESMTTRIEVEHSTRQRHDRRRYGELAPDPHRTRRLHRPSTYRRRSAELRLAGDHQLRTREGLAELDDTGRHAQAPTTLGR